jgi:hypothetical protein
MLLTYSRGYDRMDDDQVTKLQHVADLTAVTYQRFKSLGCSEGEAMRLTELVLRVSLLAPGNRGLDGKSVTPSSETP